MADNEYVCSFLILLISTYHMLTYFIECRGGSGYENTLSLNNCNTLSWTSQMVETLWMGHEGALG